MDGWSTPIPETPPNSPTFKANYGRPSSAEPVFKREKNDYTLTPLPTPSKAGLHFYARRTAFAMHIDTRMRPARVE